MQQTRGGKSLEQLNSEFFLKTRNPALKKTLNDCRQVAKSKSGILLIGESGTGKEVIASYIHALSQRANGPFVAVNCGSYSSSLLDSELFGHEKGAYTGAVSARAGKFEIANGGTLFLDEIGEVDQAIQIKLLRAIDTKSIERIGSNQLQRIDFRLISATNRPLAAAVAEGNIREDFFYRISTIVIRVPPVRERREDLPALIRFFITQFEQENGLKMRRMDREVWDFLLEYDYPGNIRELRNTVERLVVLSPNGHITAASLPILTHIKGRAERRINGGGLGGDGGQLVSWKEYKERSEAAYLRYALDSCGGNAAEAARRLGLSARQMYNKINAYGLK
ncbi:MAG: sigma-54 dependent transcriptional regulator [Bacillota bacterium]|nr:sigma-54 dependent transcriptional regulator [Bacillota bacterium]